MEGGVALAAEEQQTQTLESLLEISRTLEGRSLLAAQKTLPFLLRRLSSLDPPPLLTSLRLLRNLCAGEIANQTSFVQSGGPDVIASIVFGPVPPPVETIKVGVQVLGNVVAAGGEHRAAVWGRLFPDGFLELSGVEDPGVCDPLCMVLYFCCCCLGDDVEGAESRAGELCGGGTGLPIIKQLIRTCSSVGYRGEWLQLLLSRICFEKSCFPQLFSDLNTSRFYGDCRDSESNKAHFTKEQAFLLGILSEILGEESYKGVISSNFAVSVLQILKDASSVVDFTSRGNFPLPTDSPAINILGFSLTILKDICAIDHSSLPTTDNPVDSLLSSGLCQFLLGLLRDLEPPSIIRKMYGLGGNQGGQPSAMESLKVCPYKGFRRDTVAVIGNCMFGRKHVQDEIRRQNEILLLLQQCVTDDDNPFLREWGMWTVRNLLDGNPENQKEVAELEMQGSVDTPEIAGLGLKVEVDKQTGRVKLVNVPS